MKNITFLFWLFLANILLGACSGGEDEKKEMDEGKGAYALFLKKSITVSTGESQTDVVVEWAKTSWEITIGEGEVGPKSFTNLGQLINTVKVTAKAPKIDVMIPA